MLAYAGRAYAMALVSVDTTASMTVFKSFAAHNVQTSRRPDVYHTVGRVRVIARGLRKLFWTFTPRAPEV